MDHYKKYKLTNINPIFVFSISTTYASWGHFLAFYNISEKDGAYFQYFKYSIPENYTEAMEIYFIGILSIMIGYNFGKKGITQLPKIDFQLTSVTSFKYLFYISIFLILFNGIIVLPGSLQKIIILFPQLSLFIFNLLGEKHKINSFKFYSFSLTIICTVFAFFTSYLRSEIISPVILYIISHIVATKNLRSIISVKWIPVLILIIVFSINFDKLGRLRTMYFSEWKQRIDFLTSDIKESSDTDEDEQKKQTILSRSTVINQVTQVVKVKKEDGLYYGNTLVYLAYVFIPRFIWADKPIIQQGGWFAERIGMAYRNDTGNLNNSINMTIYGEAYLNFDYYGVVAICVLFGFFLSKLWQASGELKNYFNLMGTGFSLFLISNSVMQLGADIQIVVTLISVYLIFLFLSFTLREIYNS